MKIRIKGNSIRYRLTKPEVELLETENVIKEETRFSNVVFAYILKKTSEIAIRAELLDNTITMYVPYIMINELINTKRVGFEVKYGELSLFLEKDFKCLDSVNEDQSDNYPNPLAMHSYEQD